jgi:uracil-DNA glycosylase
MAIEHFLGRCRLEDVVGTLVERDGRRYLPLPHSSGVSRWLNDPANRALVDRAIELLAECRLRYDL